MVRSFARRSFPVVAWGYVAALGVQVFFAGMFVFAGAHNIELHKTFAHVVGLLTLLLVLAAFVGRVGRTDKRLTLAVVGLLLVQGGLVHVHQFFNMPLVAALHPVNALVLTWTSVTLARRAGAYWLPIRRPARVSRPAVGGGEPAAA